ncbi:hypothetical protein [Candidatus Borrarchaeum sp.]|uniref:hypothetical protein n=1 Tax=Candidatus Borrarchaeum sp. TaxID=2846742 RepID=UPI00257B5AC9|nr:hypothetical protein [Candidatus Borrarchaeum sp.]
MEFDGLQKVGFSLHMFLFLSLWGLLIYLQYYNMQEYVLVVFLGVLFSSTFAEFLVLGSRITSEKITVNLFILIGGFFVLLNGVGQTLLFTNSIGLSAYPPSIDIITLAGMQLSADLFSQVFSMPIMGAVIGFAILGGVLINVGDAMDNGSLYGAGALVATVLPMIILIGVLTGTIAPSDYFYQIGGSMANVLEFSALLGVLLLVLTVVFLFDDLISSATAGETYD